MIPIVCRHRYLPWRGTWWKCVSCDRAFDAGDPFSTPDPEPTGGAR